MDFKEIRMQVNSRTFRLHYVELENAVVAFFLEERTRLGTVAIAMPGSGEIASGRSSVLVGGKYIMTTRALAEKLAGKKGKISVVSLFTMLDEAEALRIYSKLLDKMQVMKEECETFPNSSVRQNA
jgi:hypothetical protein